MIGRGIGFTRCGGGVNSFVGLELSGEADVEFTGWLEARVMAAQCGNRLPDGTKGFFHGSRADRTPTGSNDSSAVAPGKDAKEGDGVVDILQGGILVE